MAVMLANQAFCLLPSLPVSERRYCDAQHHAVMLCVCVCVCVRRATYHVSTALHISLGGEGNALYPVLSGLFMLFMLVQ